jgi:hypothetical protein
VTPKLRSKFFQVLALWQHLSAGWHWLTFRIVRSYLSLGQPMSGWFSAKPLFDNIARDLNEEYLA